MTSKSSILAIIALILVLAGGKPMSAATATQANFVRTDNATQGNWKGVYGRDGYVIPDTNTNQAPGYAAFNAQNASNWTWTNNGAEGRDPQVSWSTNLRQASCWFTYASVSYTLDVNITDGNAHQFAVYALDWDGQGRTETIQAINASTGAVLNTQTVSNFSNGIYFVWNIAGHVKFNVTTTGGPNGVISGAFFDPSTSAGTASGSATAVFVSTDSTTQGNWNNAYGAEGYTVLGDTQKVASYASVTPQNQGSWIWANTSSDVRAPKTANGSSRVAATWFNTPSFNIDVNITDGKAHRLALYAIDWDSKGRAENIRVLDAQTNAVLDSQSVFNFTNGIYLVWNVSGHVKISVTSTNGPNAVISGVFFGGAGAPSTASNGSTNITPTTPTTTPTTTQTVTQTPTAPVAAAQGKLSLSSSTFNFGSVNVNGNASQTFTVTNSGNANVTISNVSVSGAGFNASGVPTGTVLNPGQTATLSVTFSPASANNVSGGVTLASNASNATAGITLSGTGVQKQHAVALNWDASSTAGIVGYSVYRATVAGGPYALMTSSPVPSTTFTDASGQSGRTYYYVVTSVDSSNAQSAYSNAVTVSIP